MPLDIPNTRVVNTTCETILDKFTGCEVEFTAGKNAALARPPLPHELRASRRQTTRRQQLADNGRVHMLLFYKVLQGNTRGNP